MSRKPLHGDASVMRIRFVHKRLMSASVSRRDEPPWIHEGLERDSPLVPGAPWVLHPLPNRLLIGSRKGLKRNDLGCLAHLWGTLFNPSAFLMLC